MTSEFDRKMEARGMDSEGTLHVPFFEVRFSTYASRESRDAAIDHYQAEMRC